MTLSRLWLAMLYWITATTGLSGYEHAPPLEIEPVWLHKTICATTFAVFMVAAACQIWMYCRARWPGRGNSGSAGPAT